ncbi:MAG: glycosyltransferase family 2 protein [Flavobacteriales bacterium]|nr:glycosyltransferase family 2 protein [Flavobacteriales bacterium]
MQDHIIDVIIPAYNEEESIREVLNDIPEFVREVVVVNNNSTDGTPQVAISAGATVLTEERQGYGSACLKGIAHIAGKEMPPHIVVFIDADYSDHPEEMIDLLEPIIADKVDMVIGSRAQGNREKGSMMPQQVFGNWLATLLIRFFHGVNYTDLGPFRAIRFESLMALGMKDKDYGWTVEMQVKAAKNSLKFAEVPVSYRKRIGESKVSGTMKGTIMAGYKIITTIFKYL